ncbi:MAG: response regulator [Deltaproteobacteria bacterium]|nr:response regulator [Deltaproteobacteria bacterium]
MPLPPDLRIITVDDYNTMRRIIKNLLGQLGYKSVLEAEDGRAALDVLKHEKVDLIISDWSMPKMTGLDLLKAVRSDPDLKNTPFIMITAEGDRERIVAAVQAGVSNFIVKPFTAETLGDKISKVFEKLQATG